MHSPIRLAVLKTDTPIDPVKEKLGDYGNIFAALIRAGADGLNQPDVISSKHGLEISSYDSVDKQEYPDPDQIDAVLITGSKYNAYDNDEWILKLVSYTAQLLKGGRVRIIGVCFGHQILGRALGAPLGKSDLGWETSVSLVQLSHKGKELFGKDILSIQQMHQDVVFEYPADVEQLGSSPRCKNQGMYKKNVLISVQGHPEFTEFIMRELLAARKAKGVFDEDTYKSGMDRVENHHDGLAISQAFVRFLLED